MTQIYKIHYSMYVMIEPVKDIGRTSERYWQNGTGEAENEQ